MCNIIWTISQHLTASSTIHHHAYRWVIRSLKLKKKGNPYWFCFFFLVCFSQLLLVTNVFTWMTSWVSRPLVDAITSNTPWQNAMTVSTMVRFMTMKSSTEIRGWCLSLHVVWPKDLLTMWANGAKMSPLMILIAQDFVLFSRKRWVLQLRQKNIFPRLARECNPLRFSLFFGILCWRDDRHVLARFV